jgi:hypothetical protein
VSEPGTGWRLLARVLACCVFLALECSTGQAAQFNVTCERTCWDIRVGRAPKCMAYGKLACVCPDGTVKNTHDNCVDKQICTCGAACSYSLPGSWWWF